ncbi:urease accessory protein UreF [Thalassococcus sp. S3]|uniref:urease accessory protein UreF n=1 Tax=Thalassococcus sp. S3 TaxID=2017482 RepID=UPI00102489F1|nr:urease accessory protein UreF [Thalassococcus sp. S3]QBF30588.1 urease accessory protein UreF [Thalassococcus sp. S3]
MPTDLETLTLTHWLSPAYPVGAFSYSHGLEWTVDQGHVSDVESFRIWLTDILTHGAGRNDAILLAASYQAVDEAQVTEIDMLARALAPSRERLMETSLQGEAFARTTSDIWPTAVQNLTYPVAIGVAARDQGFDLERTIALYLHAFAGNLTSAAIRLVPLGQTEGHAVLAAIAPLCAEIAAEAMGQTLDDLGSCAFMADIASMNHETQYSRLFRS